MHFIARSEDIQAFAAGSFHFGEPLGPLKI
jgi:hypothetical protein